MTRSDIRESVKLVARVKPDITVVNVALSSTEGYDRQNLSLGHMQDQLVFAMAEAAPGKVVVVVRSPGACVSLS